MAVVAVRLGYAGGGGLDDSGAPVTQWIEDAAMHRAQVVRTDYRFESRRAALGTLGFFFGKGVARRAEASPFAERRAERWLSAVRRVNPRVTRLLQALLADVADDGEACFVPECTGVWWRVKH